jgi:hypothetical protein
MGRAKVRNYMPVPWLANFPARGSPWFTARDQFALNRPAWLASYEGVTPTIPDWVVNFVTRDEYKLTALATLITPQPAGWVRAQDVRSALDPDYLAAHPMSPAVHEVPLNQGQAAAGPHDQEARLDLIDH